MSIRHTIAALFTGLILITNCSFADGLSEAGLSLSASTSTTRVSIGIPVMISIRLSNTTDKPLLVPFRAGNFKVEIQRDGRVRNLSVPAYTIEREDSYDYVPLLVGASYEWLVPAPLNDVSAVPETALVLEPGSYVVRVVYNSAPESGQTAKHPIWLGTIRSNPVTITVVSSSAEELTAWRGRVQACLKQDDCDTTKASNFYRVVRDPQVAETLITLLEQNPLGVWLIDAVVNQGRTGDAARLRRIAQRIDDPDVKKIYLSAAGRL